MSFSFVCVYGLERSLKTFTPSEAAYRLSHYIGCSFPYQSYQPPTQTEIDTEVEQETYI